MTTNQAILLFTYLAIAVAVGIIIVMHVGFLGALLATVLYLVAGAIWISYRHAPKDY